MKFCIHFPNFFSFSPKKVSKLARLAEKLGWDGFFLWDHLHLVRNQNSYDPLILLTSIVENTHKIKIGVMVSPIPRYTPHILARQLVTLDHLSDGRLILGVGLGMPDTEYTLFGESPTLKTRGEKLDEALEVILGFWSGNKFNHEGTHYKIPRKIRFLAKPLFGGIPIWTSSTVNSQKVPHKSLIRAARFDGVCIAHENFPIPPSPLEVKKVVQYIHKSHDSNKHFEVFLNGDNREMENLMNEYLKSGVTWWSTLINFSQTSNEIEKIILQGPPKLN